MDLERQIVSVETFGNNSESKNYYDNPQRKHTDTSESRSRSFQRKKSPATMPLRNRSNSRNGRDEKPSMGHAYSTDKLSMSKQANSTRKAINKLYGDLGKKKKGTHKRRGSLPKYT